MPVTNLRFEVTWTFPYPVTTTGYGDISAVDDAARASTIFLITPARTPVPWPWRNRLLVCSLNNTQRPCEVVSHG